MLKVVLLPVHRSDDIEWNQIENVIRKMEISTNDMIENWKIGGLVNSSRHAILHLGVSKSDC